MSVGWEMGLLPRLMTEHARFEIEMRDNLPFEADRQNYTMDLRPVSQARSQHERENPGRLLELKKRSAAFQNSERAKRNRGTIDPGVFASRKRVGFEGVPPSKRLWTESKQRRLFT